MERKSEPDDEPGSHRPPEQRKPPGRETKGRDRTTEAPFGRGSIEAERLGAEDGGAVDLGIRKGVTVVLLTPREGSTRAKDEGRG